MVRASPTQPSPRALCRHLPARSDAAARAPVPVSAGTGAAPWPGLAGRVAPLLLGVLLAAACSPAGTPPVLELRDDGTGAVAPAVDRQSVATSAADPDRPAPASSPDDPGALGDLGDLASLGPADLAEALRAAPVRLSTAATGRSRMRLAAHDGHLPAVELIVDCAWDLGAGSWSCSTWILEGVDVLDAVTVAFHPGGIHLQAPHDPAPGTTPGAHRPSPAPWVPHPAGAPDEPFTQDAVAASTAGPVVLLLGVGERAEVVGTDDVGGVPTVVLTATLDVARALDLAPPAVATEVAGHLGDWAGSGERAVAVWLDAGGVPRRLRLELPADPLDDPLDPVDPAVLVTTPDTADGDRMLLTLELADLGEPVEPAQPPPGGDGG